LPRKLYPTLLLAFVVTGEGALAGEDLMVIDIGATVTVRRVSK